MRYTLTFPHETFVGETPDSVLRQLSKQQWDASAKHNIKRALAWRTFVMTKTVLDENEDDFQFLWKFSQAGMARLEVRGD